MRCQSRLLAVATVGLLLSTGCGDSGSQRRDAQKPSSNPATESSPSASATQSTPQSPKPVSLTGYAATKANWLATHKGAPGYSLGAAYLPMVQLNGEALPKYAGVSLGNIVVEYTMNMPGGTSITEAKKMVLNEFPKGARFDISDDDQAACLIASIDSPPAEKSMKQHGWGKWVPVVAFGTATASETRLDPNNVTDVTMEPSPSKPNLGRC